MPRRSPPPAPSTEPTEPVEIFRAGSQGVMVRVVQAALVLIATPALVWGAWWLWASPPDGSMPASTQYAVAVFLLLLSLGTSVGMIVYGWCYIMSATWDPAAGACHLTLAGLFLPTRLTVTRAELGRFHEGRSDVSHVSVNAPWYSIRVPGRRLSLILDLQGEFLEPELVNRLLLGRPETRIR